MEANIKYWPCSDLCAGGREDGGVAAGHVHGGGMLHAFSAAAGEPEHSGCSAAVSRSRHEVVLQRPAGRDPGYGFITATCEHY